MFTVLGITFDYLDIAIVVMCTASLIIGYLRGFIIAIINLARKALGLFLCFYLSSNLSGIVYDNFVRPKILSRVNMQIQELGVQVVTDNIAQKLQSVPAFMKGDIDASVLSASSDNIAEIIMLNIVDPSVIVLLKVVVFVVVFILFFVCTGLIVHLVKKASDRRDKKRGHMSAIKRFDKFIGMLAGFLGFAVILFAFDSVVMFFADTGCVNDALMQQINSSVIIQFLNGINPFNAITEGLL